MKNCGNKEWLYQKYVLEELHCERIAQICSCSLRTIYNRLASYGILPRTSSDIVRTRLSKRCPGCGRNIPLIMFYKSRQSADGVLGYCKSCIILRGQLWALEHPEKVREKNRLYCIKNALKCKARATAFYNFPVAQPCFVMGCNKIGERHHSDYGKPLDIMWYCHTHHKYIEALKKSEVLI